MSDEKAEPTPTNPATVEPAPGSPLTARLLARGTDSLGLIDVRRAEQHYARIMDWLAARTPLLERLRTRYGLTEGEGSTALPFAEAIVSEGARVGDEAINLSAAPFSFNAPAAEQLFTLTARIPDDSDAPQPEAKRIARRGVPTFSTAGSETGTGRGRDGVRQERGGALEPALELAAPTREQERDLQSPPRVKETPAAAVENPGARPADPADAAQTSRPRADSSPARESISSAARQTLPSVEERAAAPASSSDQTLALGGAPFTGAFEPGGPARPGAPIVTESPGPGAHPPAPTLRVPVGAREMERTAGAFVVNEAEGMTLKRRGAAEVAERTAEVTEHTAGVAGRAAPTAAGVRLPVASETREAHASAETPRPLARAREIHAGDSGRAPASLHAQTPLPLASGPAAERAEPPRRQNDSAPAVTRTSSAAAETFTPARAQARARADELNVERLTEQVSRHLARRLQVERERRGWGRK